MKKLLAFLYKKFKRIFSKEEIIIYVSYRTGNDNNSGYNRDKPKASIPSACITANACSPNRQKRIRIVVLSEPRVHQVNVTATIDKNERIKL